MAPALLSALGRSTEGYVSEDWAAVGRAVTERMTELGLTQREVTQRSHVSKATVREIQYDTVQRRRSGRTLEALSLALDWHPDHLTAVLHGHRPPRGGDPVARPDDDIPGRLAVIEHYLREITDRLGEIGAINERLEEIRADVETLTKHVGADGKRLDI
jgi:hypothetical protein